MNPDSIHLLLADDDKDDCLFFEEALEESTFNVRLTTVHDGEQLMRLLGQKTADLPALLFLDLNMPRKNGFECLMEIKANEQLKQLPVIVYSTSFDPDIVNMLYDIGAQYYIRKPAEFSKLKQVVHEALARTTTAGKGQPGKDKFVLQP